MRVPGFWKNESSPTTWIPEQLHFALQSRILGKVGLSLLNNSFEDLLNLICGDILVNFPY